MVATLLCLATLVPVAFVPVDNGYAGLPQLQSPNPYRILSESVQIKIGKSAAVQITGLAVYRNQGPTVQAKMSFSDGLLTGPAHIPDMRIVVTWDNQPLPLLIGTDSHGETTASATVTLNKDATHTLRLVSVPATLARTGYAQDERGFRFRLAGDHPIELFTMAYQYGSAGLFGLPTIQPELGWEIGAAGASIRKPSFTPTDAETSIRFYRDSMRDLGKPAG